MRRQALIAVLLGAMASYAPPARAASPELTFILQSMTAEEQVERKRANLTFIRAATETHYRIDRVLPDRLRMRWRRAGQDGELVVIGKRTFTRQASGWNVSPSAPVLETPLSMTKMFEQRLVEVKELPTVTVDGRVQRVFDGKISWFAGKSRNAGDIRIHIERDSRLPRRMSFTGMCGKVPCSFEHVLTYDPGLAIEPPI